VNASISRVAVEKGPSVAADLARGTLWFIWRALRLPIFVFLVVLESIVRVVLIAVALLGVFVSFFLKIADPSPLFPFWGMLGFSVSCGVLLMLYYALIHLLAR
jgi:hypothetical protein